MKAKKLLAMGLAFVMAGTMMVGCGGSASNEATPKETGAAPAQTEGTATAGEKCITVGSGQACTTLDVCNSYDGWYLVRYGVGQTLTKINDDMTISGWLVEDDYTASEDMKTWTFHIKDGVTFSNGNKVDAEAVKKSLQNVIDNCERTPDYFAVESMEADGQTLTVTCAEPEPIFANKLADPLFTVVDMDNVPDNVVDNGYIGTGPFVYESWDPISRECVVVKNENYWGGEVKMDKVRFVFTEDQPTLTNAMKTGEFDSLYNCSMTDIGEFEGDDNFTISRTASGRTTHGFMNQHGLLGDDVLRQAILKSLDRETFCQVLLNGQYVAGKTLITSSAAYGYDELTDPNAYDPDGAVKMLEEAGYKDNDGDGVLETPDGKPVELNFVYYTGRPEQQVVVEATQQELAKIGIKINITVNESSIVQEKLISGDYDLLCMSISVLNCADPEAHLKKYFSANGTENATGWSDDEYEAILKELSETSDAEKRVELVKQAQQILLDQAVCIYYCYPLMNFINRAGVTGLNSTPCDYYWISETTDVN